MGYYKPCMHIQHFYEPVTATFTYVVSDDKSPQCAIIDPVLDYDFDTKKTSTQSADQIIDYVRKQGLMVQWILETHVHADHLTASPYLKEQLGGDIGIGTHICDVLAYWVPHLHLEEIVPLDGSQFDKLFEDQETFFIGGLEVKVIYTPGHTPACVCYQIEDAVFVGDTLFVPRMGTARTDFPGGDAVTLYRSIHKILALDPKTRVFVGHDYPPSGESPQCESNIEDERLYNKMIHEKITEAEFVEKRQARDKTLEAPRLLYPSIDANMRGWQKGISHVQ